MPKHKIRLWNKQYTLPESNMKNLMIPSVDSPVAAISSAAILPSEGKGGPKDSIDKRVETFLRRDFEASALALRATSANSIMARVAFVWANDLAKIPKIPKKARSINKKISLVSAYDSLQLSARAMAVNVVARRSLWLRQWDGDAASP